jgi:hypothetical protein
MAHLLHIASMPDENLAHQLRKTSDLGQRLPQWLGWVVSPLGESPLSAAVLGGDLDVVKKLFDLNPKLMGSVIHARYVLDSCVVHS